MDQAFLPPPVLVVRLLVPQKNKNTNKGIPYYTVLQYGKRRPGKQKEGRPTVHHRIPCALQVTASLIDLIRRIGRLGPAIALIPSRQGRNRVPILPTQLLAVTR